ncbi:hypothetical protein LS68_008140 [Helicobacter sp. MIT 05-5293]|uniref:DUF4376 domain-containing protein n=1 Tax=Helicobacter sp. MIT 05-5293 TaxID=1548149 RepID=UPI00051D8B09|nr:hypothetical protein [Helicobacter sp. MIT 05-5293]TLD80178.1 hypothetical protein LS68_008140 [Helicobacter sp. MIT 05-5293]
MKKIYSLIASQITQVQGNFHYLGEENGKVYVEGEDLESPFVEDLLPHNLEAALQTQINLTKEQKIKELNAMCDSLLTSFKSSALGEEHIYDGGLEDQLNLMGAVALNKDMPFRCAKKGESKANVPHTQAQLEQVYTDWLNYKNDIIFICGMLKNYIEGLSDTEEIQRVSWDSYQNIQAKLEE